MMVQSTEGKRMMVQSTEGKRMMMQSTEWKWMMVQSTEGKWTLMLSLVCTVEEGEGCKDLVEEDAGAIYCVEQLDIK